MQYSDSQSGTTTSRDHVTVGNKHSSFFLAFGDFCHILGIGMCSLETWQLPVYLVTIIGVSHILAGVPTHKTIQYNLVCRVVF